MKRKIQILLFLLFLVAVACERPPLPRPENLVKKSKMIDMMVDIHLAEATYNRFRNDSIMRNNSSANFYYSVLNKYNVPDSVFEQSFVYYSSVPKDFEKMCLEVSNRLGEMEQEYSGKKREELEFNDKKMKIQ